MNILSRAGDFPANPTEKAGYRLDFHDDFSGAELDQSKWLPLYLPQWSTLERSRPNYRLRDQSLILEISADQPPWCPEFDGQTRCSSLQTGLFAGEVGSPFGQHRFNPACVVREPQATQRTYTPQYGYFELRAKGRYGANNVVSLWMIGFEDRPERSAEIAVMEIKGSSIRDDGLTLGYGVHPWSDPAIRDEFFEDFVPISSAEYHIYAVEWTPTHIDVYLDNRKLRTINQSPDYPMQFMLGIYEIELKQPGQAAPTPAIYPKEFIIDYVRAYQPIGGY
jgi:hypothetical protein